jgi:hypothetical protein
MEEEKHTQIPTIKKAITYIVDENGQEIEQVQQAEAKAEVEKENS